MSRNPFRKTVGFYEVMTTSYTSGEKSQMAYTQASQMDNPPHQSPRNVGFNLKEQLHENKKKFLTAKYGQHQMLLIKKRLGVEMWIFDELRRLYQSENDDHDCELDLEEILNMDTDDERRQYALEQLQDAKENKEEIDNFVEELLRRAKTL